MPKGYSVNVGNLCCSRSLIPNQGCPADRHRHQLGAWCCRKRMRSWIRLEEIAACRCAISVTKNEPCLTPSPYPFGINLWRLSHRW